MADFFGDVRVLNPLVLHLRKMGLALQCPSCLTLYSKPMLLPCNHIVCSSCVSKPALFGLQCPECKHGYGEQDLRPAPYMENLMNIYRSLDAAFSSHILQPILTDHERDSEPLTNSAAKPPMELGENFRFRTSIEPYGVSGELNHLRSCSQTGAPKDVQPETIDLDIKQVACLPTESPQTMNTDTCGCNLAIGDNVSGECSLKQGLTRSADVRSGDSTSLSEVHGLPTKKLKQSNSSSVELEGNSLSESSSPKKLTDSSGSRGPKSTNSRCFICGFCRTWKVMGHMGPMLHYYKGKLVEGNDMTHPDVIHVHSICIDWAPQVYYVDDTVKNLNMELSRSAKLKCSHCGIKGAALGCYEKTCRRTYHVPCALDIPECVWDTDNYLMLCPAHSSCKFPGFKSSRGRNKSQAGQIQISSEESPWDPLSTGTKKWVLCGSALSVDDKLLLVKFATMCEATVVKSWNPNVTHVIAATDANNAYSRTLKVLMAILKGCWILKLDWIKACMEAAHLVEEEPYEVCVDNHGCRYGPRIGRLRALTDASKLFAGLRFYLTSSFVRTYKEDLQDLIVAAGGIILDNDHESSGQIYDRTVGGFRMLVVYNSEFKVGSEDACEVSNGRVQAENLAVEMGAQVIAHTWLLDSIASSELQPIAQI